MHSCAVEAKRGLQPHKEPETIGCGLNPTLLSYKQPQSHFLTKNVPFIQVIQEIAIFGAAQRPFATEV